MTSSSEDENLEFLREATDTHFINDSMYNGTGGSVRLENHPNKHHKSLRREDENDDQFSHLRVTPEFRAHVAKHLSKFLDEQLVYVVQTAAESNSERKLVGGVKLMRDAHNYVQHTQKEVNRVKKKKIKKRKVRLDDGCSSEDESVKVRQAAVAPERVLSGEEVKHWTQFKKSAVFRYRKSKTGLLESKDAFA